MIVHCNPYCSLVVKSCPGLGDSILFNRECNIYIFLTLTHSRSPPNLRNLRFLVLDEADRLLSESFQKDLKVILSTLPRSDYLCVCTTK